ncbi:MAG: AEC family transporter [Cellulosilyticaceae bacterium]
MENLMFSLNATIPIFLLMVIGYFLRRLGMFEDTFAHKLNGFVFKVGLPVLVFKELSTADFYATWDTLFVVFCFGASLLSILVALGGAKLVKDQSIRGEFVQAAYRSSAALLGCAFVENIYGKAGPAALMIVGSVPLYNIAAVIILNRMKPNGGDVGIKVIKETLYQVVTNPIIIGIAIGFIWSVLKLEQPEIMRKTVESVAGTATPLGLMTLGATFDFKKTKASIKPAILCSFFKLIVFAGMFLPVAIGLGFRQEKLVALLVMLGGATTVSCFIMARNLQHEGTLTSSVVALTTLASAFTLTGWLFVLRSCMLI